MPGPFDGIRVVDFGRYIAGPFCAALLGDLGAEVIRVEKRDGREDRTLVPLAENEDGTPREGAMFLQMNRNKRSLTLDPMNEAGREVVRRLVRTADVVVANLPAETLKAMGLDYDSVSRGSIRARSSPSSRRSGSKDPMRRASASTAWRRRCRARCISPARRSSRCARRRPGWISERRRCWRSASSAALRARETTGRGQLVEGALLRTALTFFSPTLIEEDRAQARPPADAQPQPDGRPVRHLPHQGRLDHGRGERRSAVPPRGETDRCTGMARGSALCERQGARR